MSGTSESSAASPFGHWLSAIVPAVIPDDASLARAVGVPQSTVLRWRRGTRPSAKSVLALSQATGTSADTLLRIAEYKEDDDK